jgi:vitamin B12 transporter
LFGRPKHEFSGAITVKPTEKLTATFDGYLRSKFFSDFPSSFEMPSYEVFGITLGYEITPSIRLTGKVQNLFDKIYEEKLGDSTYGRTAQLRVNVVF